MTASRRRVVSVLSIALTGGCVWGGAGGTTPYSDPVGPTPQRGACEGGEHAITDVQLSNDRDSETRVAFEVRETASEEPVLRRTVLLASNNDHGSTLNICDVFADETAYRITVTANGQQVTKEWAGEFNDNKGLVVLVEPEGLDVFEVEH